MEQEKEKPYGYDALCQMRNELAAKRPMVGTDDYSSVLAIDADLRRIEQGIPIHHSGKAWWDNVHTMD